MDHPETPLPWPAWLETNGRRFLLFARSQARGEADAQDILQEALVEAWQRSGHCRPPDDALVFATIRRRAIDFGRRAERRERREQAAPAWFEPAPVPQDPEADAELARAVQRLSPPLREVVIMKIWSELTFRQIADALSISINTASSRYRYALDHLHAALKDVCP